MTLADDSLRCDVVTFVNSYHDSTHVVTLRHDLVEHATSLKLLCIVIELNEKIACGDLRRPFSQMSSESASVNREVGRTKEVSGD